MVDWIKAIFVLIMVVILVFVVIWGMTNVNVEAYTGGSCELEPEILCDIGTGMGFPAGWLAPDKMIAWIIAPGILVVAVVYGFISTIFRDMLSKWVSIIIALAIGLIVTFSGHFTILVVALYSILGIYALILGGILGIGLIVMLVWRKGFSRFRDQAISTAKKAYDKEEDRVKDEIKECNGHIKEIEKQKEEFIKTNPGITDELLTAKLDDYDEALQYWHEKRERLKKQLKELKEEEKETIEEIKEETKD